MRSGSSAFWVAVVIAAAPASGLGATPAKEGAPAPAAGDPALDGQDIDHPPPGSPEDVALWKAGMQVTTDVPVERARASRLQLVLLNLKYADRLATLADRGGKDKEHAAGLSKRLSDAMTAQHYVQTARWPVDTYRVCGYPAMQFGSMLAAGRNTPEELAKNRAILVGCVEGAQAALKLQKESNDRLAAAMADAEAALEAAGLGASTLAQKTADPASVKAAPAAPAGAQQHDVKHGERVEGK